MTLVPKFTDETRTAPRFTFAIEDLSCGVLS